jgi:integrase-like protein
MEITAGNAAANYFGGCTSIADITFLKVSSPVASNTTACNTSEDGSYPDTGIYLAMQVNGQPAYVKCFADKYDATYQVKLYGVYAIWTGSNDYKVSYTWEDYNGGIHTSTLDNIFTERLWRTVKYEEVYIHDYLSPREVRQALTRCFKFYNQERLHQALDYQTPAEVYFSPGMSEVH